MVEKTVAHTEFLNVKEVSINGKRTTYFRGTKVHGKRKIRAVHPDSARECAKLLDMGLIKAGFPALNILKSKL